MKHTTKITEKIYFSAGEPIASSNLFRLVNTEGEIHKKVSTASRAEGTYWFIRKGALLFNLTLSTYQSVKLRVRMPQRIGENTFEIVINGSRFGPTRRFVGYEDFSEGVYDISELVKSGDNQIGITSAGMALDEISVDIEEETDKKLLIKNPTGLVLEVYHKNSSEDKSELFLAQLYAHEELHVENRGTYSFKTVNTKKIVDRFNCSSEQLDPYQIKYKTPDASTANAIAVKNDSNMEISLEKIDFHGKFKQVSVLPPGGRYTGPAYLDEPHVLRDTHSGAVVDFFYAKYMGENRNRFSAHELDNLARARPTTVRFINCEDREIRLSNKIEKRWREIVKVGIGQIYEQATHSGQVWEFAIPQGGTSVSAYYFIPSADEFQSVFIIDKKKGVEVSFKNQTHFTLKAYKKVGDQRYFFGYIAPQSMLTRYSYKNSAWEFTAMVGEEETGTIHSQQVSDAGTYPLSGNLLGTLSQQRVGVRKVNFINQASVAVKVQKQSDDLSAVELGEVLSAGELAFECAVGSVLDIRDLHDHSKIGQVIVPAGEDAFNYSVEMKSLHSSNPSRLTVNNHTSLALDLIWLDYQGKEVKYPGVEAGGAIAMNTFLTHPWLVKERRSGRIIKRVYGLEQDEIVDIYDGDLVKVEQPVEVGINFSNTLPFAVDLYEVITNREEELVGTLHEGETISMNNKNAAPVRIREHSSQELVDIYIPTTRSSQQFEVQPTPISGSQDAEVEVFNLSFFDLDIYTFGDQGQRVKIHTVETRMSVKLDNAKVGQSFFLQERKSEKVVGYFLATEKPVRYEFTGLNLRSAAVSGDAATLTIRNKSTYSGTLYLVDYEGNRVSKGTLAGNSEIQLMDALSGNVYVFIEHISGESPVEIMLDQAIVGDQVGGVIDLLPDPISKTKRTHHELWPGEVALFTAENYQGDSFIFHADLYTFLDKINDKVRSIKLGPGTALTVYEHTRFAGINDVYHLDMPNLTETDVKLTLSSFQISYIVPESTTGISAISRLTEEPIVDVDTTVDNINHRSVYRTTISFPPMVSAVDVYTTEESTFEVRGNAYTADPVKCAKIVLGDNKQLVITTEANTLEQAIFMVRANTMKANERFFVFQDIDLYKKILNMEQGSLARNRNKLGAESTLSNNDLDGVQAALQNLAATMPAVHGTKAHGSKQDLYVMTDTMEYDSWGLSFGDSGTEALFRPLSSEEMVIATRQGDDTVIRRNLDNEAGQGLFDDVWGNVKGVVVGAADVVSSAASTAAGGITAIANGIADTAQTVVTTGVSVATSALDTASEALDKGASLVSGAADLVAAGAAAAGGMVVEGASQAVGVVSAIPSVVKEVAITAADGVGSVAKAVLKATIDLGTSIVEFTLDTVDKIKSCIEMIANKVFSAVKGVINFFKDLFSWKDILDTKDMIAHFVHDKFDLLANEAFPMLEAKVDNMLENLEQTVTSKLDEIIADLSTGLPEKEEEPSAFDEIKDKICWFFDKVFGSDDSPTQQTASEVAINEGTDNSNEDSSPILIVISELKDKLSKIINESGKAVADSLLDGLESITDAVTGKGDPVKRIIIGVLSVVKALAFVGFGVVKLISTIILKLVKLVLVFIKELLNETVHIPFVSALYKKLTGNELSALDLISLIIAAPATILSKLVYGKSPRASAQPAGQSIALTNNILIIINTSTLMVLSVVGLVQGIQEYVKGAALPPPGTPVEFPLVDTIVLGVNVILLLISLTAEILSQIERGAVLALSFFGWLTLFLSYVGLAISAIPAISLIQSGTDEPVADFTKMLTAIFAVVMIPVFILNKIADAANNKDEKYLNGDRTLALIGGMIAFVPNLCEASMLRSYRRVPEAASRVAADSLFFSMVNIQFLLKMLAAGVTLVGGAVAISKDEDKQHNIDQSDGEYIDWSY